MLGSTTSAPVSPAVTAVLSLARMSRQTVLAVVTVRSGMGTGQVGGSRQTPRLICTTTFSSVSGNTNTATKSTCAVCKIKIKELCKSQLLTRAALSLSSIQVRRLNRLRVLPARILAARDF